MSKSIFCFAFAAVYSASSFVVFAADATSPASKSAALNFTMESLDGKSVDLSQYQGKVVLIVNTASKCGLTPQYAPLEKLFQKYEDKGLVILGFPCNQFHEQEPGSSGDIKTFCTTKYGVTFPMFAKVEVNGDNACPLYKYLKGLSAKPKGPGEVTWNFEKFILNRNGEVVARFAPKARPESADVMKVIDAELAKK
jgi:glutathione peroxidase